MGLLFPLALAPAQAIAGTLTDLAPENVGLVSATLRAEASGFPEGTYCEILLGTGTPTQESASPQWGPAEPCKGKIEYRVHGLQAATHYAYTAAVCELVHMGELNGKPYPECEGGYGNPNGWKEPVPCSPYLAKEAPECPNFTTKAYPEGVTKAATHVLGSSAVFNAELEIFDLAEPQGGVSSEHVEYFFEYATDPELSGAIRTPISYLPNGVTNPTPPVSVTVTGLAPNTVYYYRVVVGAKELYSGTQTTPSYYDGPTLSFRTGGYATTLPATGVGENTATLHGELRAGDEPLTYHWVYAQTETVNNQTGLLNGASAGSGTVAAGAEAQVSTTVTGLTPGTTYYFQLQTSNPSIHGAVVAFSTSSPCPHTALRSYNIPGTGFVVTGCFTVNGSQYIGYGNATVNGFSLFGPASSELEINTSTATVTVRGKVNLQAGPLLLGTIAASFHYQNGEANGKTTSTLEIVPDPSATVFGFPVIGGVTVVDSAAGTGELKIAVLGLPALFGGISAEARATVSAEGKLEGLKVQSGDALIGPFELPSIVLEYHGETGIWSGEAILHFPLVPKGLTVEVQARNDQLISLGGSFSGISIPLPGEVTISGLGINAGFQPFSWEGSIELGWGPNIGKVQAFGGNFSYYIGIDADQTIKEIPGIENGTVLHDVPLTIGVKGVVNLLGFIRLAEGSAFYYDLPYPLLTVRASLAQPLVTNCGKYGWGILPRLSIAGVDYGSEFDIVGKGGLGIDFCVGTKEIAEAEAVISTKGMAVCGAVLGNSLGVGVTWPKPPIQSLAQIENAFNLFITGECSLSAYEQTIALPKLAAAKGAGKFTLPAGLPNAVLRVRGRRRSAHGSRPRPPRLGGPDQPRRTGSETPRLPGDPRPQARRHLHRADQATRRPLHRYRPARFAEAGRLRTGPWAGQAPSAGPAPPARRFRGAPLLRPPPGRGADRLPGTGRQRQPAGSGDNWTAGPDCLQATGRRRREADDRRQHLPKRPAGGYAAACHLRRPSRQASSSASAGGAEELLVRPAGELAGGPWSDGIPSDGYLSWRPNQDRPYQTNLRSFRAGAAPANHGNGGGGGPVWPPLRSGKAWNQP